MSRSKSPKPTDLSINTSDLSESRTHTPSPIPAELSLNDSLHSHQYPTDESPEIEIGEGEIRIVRGDILNEEADAIVVPVPVDGKLCPAYGLGLQLFNIEFTDRFGKDLLTLIKEGVQAYRQEVGKEFAIGDVAPITIRASPAKVEQLKFSYIFAVAVPVKPDVKLEDQEKIETYKRQLNETMDYIWQVAEEYKCNSISIPGMFAVGVNGFPMRVAVPAIIESMVHIIQTTIRSDFAKDMSTFMNTTLPPKWSVIVPADHQDEYVYLFKLYVYTLGRVFDSGIPKWCDSITEVKNIEGDSEEEKLERTRLMKRLPKICHLPEEVVVSPTELEKKVKCTINNFNDDGLLVTQFTYTYPSLEPIKIEVILDERNCLSMMRERSQCVVNFFTIDSQCFDKFAINGDVVTEHYKPFISTWCEQAQRNKTIPIGSIVVSTFDSIGTYTYTESNEKNDEEEENDEENNSDEEEEKEGISSLTSIMTVISPSGRATIEFEKTGSSDYQDCQKQLESLSTDNLMQAVLDYCINRLCMKFDNAEYIWKDVDHVWSSIHRGILKGLGHQMFALRHITITVPNSTIYDQFGRAFQAKANSDRTPSPEY